MNRKFSTILLIGLLLVTPILNFNTYKVQGGVQRIIRDKLVFECYSLPWFSQSDKAADVIASELAAVGIKLEIRRLDSSIYYPNVENFKYQSHILATSQSPNPMDMIETFQSSRAMPGIGSFWTLEDPEVDALINQTRTATNEATLKSLLYTIQEKIANESGFIPIYLTQSVKVIRAEWKNYTVMSGGLLEVNDIWSILYMYKSEVPSENVLRIAFPSDIGTMNPFMAVDLRSLWVINLVYDPLVRINKNLAVVPWLAESWNVSPDGQVYTFHLRKGVYWHDGAPFTADDVVYTFTQGINQNTTRFITYRNIIRSVEKVDDYTVKFTLKQPYPFFLLSLATNYIYMVPKHIIEGVDLRTWSNPKPVGTGPFKWSERVIGETIILDKNANFWMNNVPKITRVVVKIIPDAESRFLAIKNGEMDTERYDTAITLISQAKQDPNLKVVTAPGIWLVYLDFNTHSFFNDPKVFEAIQYAINRTEVIEKANGGYGYPVYTVLNKYWHGVYAANITFEYNPNKAKEILESAGWKDIDGDGIREYVGVATPQQSVTTTTPQQGFPINNTQFQALANVVTSMKSSIESLGTIVVATIVLVIINLIITLIILLRIRRKS